MTERRTTDNPEVQGRCPACLNADLFLNSGGHVTCSLIDCPAPYAADELLRFGTRAPAGQGPEETDTRPGQPLAKAHAEAVRAANLPPGTRVTRAVVDEAVRQMNADPHGLKAGLIVKPYTEHGQQKWVFRCWGTDDGCDGWLSLDHYSEQSAQRARDRHIAEEHGAPGPCPACRRADQAGLAPGEQHPDCAKEQH